jgi:rod shape-determining protein MreC
MESVLGRYRNLIILVGVLFLQVLGLAVQVKRQGNDAEHTRLIRVWAVGAITPLERAVIWFQSGTGNIWHNYFYLRGVRAENRQLKEQIEQMRVEQVRLSEDAAQARRLQNLLAFKEQFISKTVAAQVIGTSGTDLSIYIDKGENAGLKRDMAVIPADGIVGKVLVVYPSVSQVLLVSDQSSGVGAILEKTRLQGVLRGTANGEVVLERVMSDEQVPVGETVLTSGGDRIFPKGLPIGTVAKVSNGKDLFLNIKIRPAANLSKLEEVLVLVEKQDRQATAEDSVRVRAADILAQRLPSVPDKPVADAKAVEGAAAGKNGVAATSNAAKPQPQSKPDTGAAPKPQGLAGSPKPAGVVAPKSTDQTSTAPKTSGAIGGAATAPATSASKSVSAGSSSSLPATPKPKASKPISADPNGVGPSTPPPTAPAPTAPQANPQAPANEGSPQ